MEQSKVDLRGPAAGRFLSDLRALRAQAGLDHGELAARAHYPRDVITSAESALPELPVLAAYVRGCGGTSDELLAWEDRWRSVTGVPARPLRSARVAGHSGSANPGAFGAAAGAFGAAAGAAPYAGTPALDGGNPEAVLAALHRFGERMSQPTPAGPVPPQDEAQPPQDKAQPPQDKAQPRRGKEAQPFRDEAAASRAAPVAEAPPPQVPVVAAAGGQHRTVILAGIAAAVLLLLIILLAL